MKKYKMGIRPAVKSYTAGELRKLAKLAKKRGKKKFASAKELLQHIEGL